MADFKAALGEAFISEALNPESLYSPRRKKSVKNEPDKPQSSPNQNSSDQNSETKEQVQSEITEKKCVLKEEEGLTAEKPDIEREVSEQPTVAFSVDRSSSVTIDSGICDEIIAENVEDNDAANQQGLENVLTVDETEKITSSSEPDIKDYDKGDNKEELLDIKQVDVKKGEDDLQLSCEQDGEEVGVVFSAESIDKSTDRSNYCKEIITETNESETANDTDETAPTDESTQITDNSEYKKETSAEVVDSVLGQVASSHKITLKNELLTQETVLQNSENSAFEHQNGTKSGEYAGGSPMTTSTRDKVKENKEIIDENNSEIREGKCTHNKEGQVKSAGDDPEGLELFHEKTGNENIDNEAGEFYINKKIDMASSVQTEENIEDIKNISQTQTKEDVMSTPKKETKEIILTPEELEKLEAGGELEGMDMHSCVITVVSETETTVERTVVFTDSGKEEVLDEKEIGKTHKTKVEVTNEDSDTESQSALNGSSPSAKIHVEKTHFDVNQDQPKASTDDILDGILDNKQEPSTTWKVEQEVEGIAAICDVPEMTIESVSCDLEKIQNDQEGAVSQSINSELLKNVQPELEAIPLEEKQEVVVKEEKENIDPVMTKELTPPEEDIIPDTTTTVDQSGEFEFFKSCIFTKSIDLEGFMNFPAEEWVFVTYEKETNDLNERLVLLSTELYNISDGACCRIL